MVPLNECVEDFKKELKKGKIQRAYKGIFDFLAQIKTHLLEKNPGYASSGSLYHGYLDMSYFPVTTDVFKKHKLKIAVVFNYESFQLEVWLSGSNRNTGNCSKKNTGENILWYKKSINLIQ